MNALFYFVASWCSDPTLEPDQYESEIHDMALLWTVEDDPNAWVSIVTNPTLSTNPASSLYYQPIIQSLVDKASQDWSRLARTRTKLGFKAFDANLTGGDDGKNGIVFENCGEGTFPARAAMYPGECDIYFRGLNPGAGWPCLARDLAIDVTDDDQGTSGVLERTFAHEMGHCLGASEVGDDTNGCLLDCIDEGPMMSPTGCGRFTDLPHPDDVHAHQAAVEPSFGLPRRTVFFSTGSYNSSGVFSASTDIEFAGSSAYPARIDCRTSATPAPHCVMARTYTESEIRYTRLTFPGANPTSVSYSTTPIAANSRRASDVAMSAATDTAVIVYVDTSVGATSEALLGTRVARFSTTADSHLGTVDLIANSQAIERSTFEPRVTFVRGIGASSCATPGQPCGGGGICGSNEICSTPAGPFGRYVVGMVMPNRRLRLFRSADAAGNGQANPAKQNAVEYVPISLVNNFGQPTEFDPIDGSFDIACPKHLAVTGPNLTELRRCRITFTAATQATLTQRLTQCWIELSAGAATATIKGCSTTVDMRAPSIASLTDYGTGQGSGQLQGRHWVLSTTRQQPHLTSTNAREFLFADVTGGLLNTWLQRADFDMDAQACLASTADDNARTYFGEVNSDYCDVCDRFIRVRSGYFVNQPDPLYKECK